MLLHIAGTLTLSRNSTDSDMCSTPQRVPTNSSRTSSPHAKRGRGGRGRAGDGKSFPGGVMCPVFVGGCGSSAMCKPLLQRLGTLVNDTPRLPWGRIHHKRLLLRLDDHDYAHNSSVQKIRTLAHDALARVHVSPVIRAALGAFAFTHTSMIWSQPGCRTQFLHCDVRPEVLQGVHVYSLVMCVTPQPAHLWVVEGTPTGCPKSGTGVECRVDLCSQGDYVIFHRLVAHRGGSTDIHHLRIFTLLVPVHVEAALIESVQRCL
jgi:hypothetical protein